jgi:hypothetical protein
MRMTADTAPLTWINDCYGRMSTPLPLFAGEVGKRSEAG